MAYSETDSLEPLLGWALAALLVMLTFGAFFAVGTLADERLAATPIPAGAVAIWRDDQSITFTTIIAFVVCLTVPGAFGFSRYQFLPRLDAKGKGILVAGFGLAIIGNTMVEAVQGARYLGVATLSGVAWREEGRVIERHAWADAEGVEVRCRTSRTRGLNPSPDFTLAYTVIFQDGRSARLADGQDVTQVTSALGRIDEIIRLRRLRRAYDVDPNCVRHVLGLRADLAVLFQAEH